MEINTAESVFNFLNQGWVGSVIGLTGTFIGVILSILFFLKSKRRAKPSVQCSRMTVLSPQQDNISSDVKITYMGDEIGQLSKTNVIFWNAGTETLHGSSVVEDSPIRISFDEETTILRFQIVKETRSVNKSFLKIVDGQKYSVDILFDYLDPNDGINIEILHDSNSDPTITGSIKGLPAGVKVIKSFLAQPAQRLKSTEYTTVGFKIFNITFLYSFVNLTFFLFGVIVFMLGASKSFGVEWIRPSKPTNSVSTAFLLATGCIYMLISAVPFFMSRKRYPKNLSEQ